MLSQISDESGDVEIATLVLDVKDAFMGVPLHAAERPFNACSADLDIRRGREPHFDGEADVGRFVVWNVLGFGGKPNPWYLPGWRHLPRGPGRPSSGRPQTRRAAL